MAPFESAGLNGYRQEITITDATLEFVTLDFGHGDVMRVALKNAAFQFYGPTDVPPEEFMVMPPESPFVLIISKVFLNYILYEVPE